MNWPKKMLLILTLLAALNCVGYSQAINTKGAVLQDGVISSSGILSPHIYKWVDFHANTIPADTTTTSIPNVQLRAAVKLIERLRIDSLLSARDIDIMRAHVLQKSDQVNQLRSQIETYKALQANYEKQIANFEKQTSLNAQIISGYGRNIRKANTSKWLVGAGGIAGMIITGYFTYKWTH